MGRGTPPGEDMEDMVIELRVLVEVLQLPYGAGHDKSTQTFLGEFNLV